MASDSPSELKVWVDGYQRCIAGITETTTVQEVVIALAQAVGQTGRYTLVEKWRSTERLLPPQECPLALLQKWGHYKKDIQFILRRSDKSVSGNSNNNNNTRSGPQHQNSHSQQSPYAGQHQSSQQHQHHQHQQSMQHHQSQQNYHQNQSYQQHQTPPQNYTNSRQPNYNRYGQLSRTNYSGSHPDNNNKSLSSNNTIQRNLSNLGQSSTLPHNLGPQRNTNTSSSLPKHYKNTSMTAMSQSSPGYSSLSNNNMNNLNNLSQNPQNLQNPNQNSPGFISKKHQDNVNKIEQDMAAHARSEYKKTIIKQEQSLEDIENEIKKFDNEIAKLTSSIASTVNRIDATNSNLNGGLGGYLGEGQRVESHHSRTNSYPLSSGVDKTMQLGGNYNSGSSRGLGW